MTAIHPLSWENFRLTVQVPGEQRVHRFSDAPRIEVFADGDASRLGMWVEIPAGTVVPPELSKRAFITLRTVRRDGRDLLEVVPAVNSLQRQFYHFAVAVAERMTEENRPVIAALMLELESFDELLEETPLLAIERQIGLFGELVLLERLLSRMGARALDAWVSPLREPHDFRLAGRELEVKTTVAPQRIHTIHGADQLVPSEGHALYLVSVVLGPAGAGDGCSLADKVTVLSERLASDRHRQKQFVDAIRGFGFKESDRAQYTRRFVVRRPLALISVDSAFPAITRTTVQRALGPLATRIEAIDYVVNAEGLGHEDGTPEFESVIPS
jgi:hypothetical protein